jgi:hypothetical protein
MWNFNHETDEKNKLDGHERANKQLLKKIFPDSGPPNVLYGIMFH